VVRDSAGVEMVVNARPLWPRDSGWRVDTAPITRIGGDERDPQQQFTNIAAAQRMSDGRVIVATNTEVRWFDSLGTYLYSSGRAGDGPGEYRYLRSVYRVTGDSVLAADGLGRRVAMYGPDGAFARQVPVDFEKLRDLGHWGECDSVLLPDGSRLLCQADPSIPLTATNRASRRRANGWSTPGPGRLRQLARRWVTTPALDRAYPLGITSGIEQYMAGPDGARALMHPFYSMSAFASGGSPLRIVMMLNPEYRIEVWTANGTLERVIERAQARRVPTAAERASSREEAMRRAGGGMDARSLASLVDGMPLPDSLAAAQRVVVSQLGEIIVQREGWIPGQPRSLFDVFDARGRWLGEIALPARTGIFDAGQDFVLTVRLDEDDRPFVEVMRLQR
jgi:hypothetical protein